MTAARLRGRRQNRHDAVVIGSGPNGLVGANVLADAGWSVLVLEAQPTPGGGVSSASYLGDGLLADVCSAFYPLAVASPAMTSLHLETYGLEWRRAPVVLANPLPGGGAAALHSDVEQTAEALDAIFPGDGAAWREMYALFERVSGPFLDALCTPFPPVVPTAKILRALGAAGSLRFARLATLPVRGLGEEELGGMPGRLLLAGCAAHTDVSPESAGGALFGWFLAMLGQRYGFPVPVGGAGQLTAALIRRLESRGGEIACGQRVARVQVRRGRAVGVVTDDGTLYGARRAVLADVSAPLLYSELLESRRLPPRIPDDVRRFHWDQATVKVDWNVRGPIPWSADVVRHAGTVHIANNVDELTRYSAEIAMGEIPRHPFLLVGQAAVADPSRASDGRQAIWAYTHVPAQVRGDPFGVVRGPWDEAALFAFADRLEARIESHAPGFGALVTGRHVMGPIELAAHDANLVDGALSGGTSGLHQQLLFRPLPGLGRPETPVTGLYLASASAHPGGGVHGACGWNAARAALKTQGAAGWVAGRGLVAAERRLKSRGRG